MEQGREAHCSAEETFTTDYKMMMTLGQGLFSEVKLAFHVPTVSCVAVKILRNKKKYASFINSEISIMKSLTHANIIKLFHVVHTRETTYLVMEHASEGDLLHHILELGSLEEREARRLFIQILHAVQYCHDNSIAHRDIKAGNILLDCRGNAKLGDFGLSAKVIPEQKFSGFCGTLYYCAPELFGEEAYDGRATDIWSLGVLLFLMVAGYFPFRASSVAGVKQQILAANFKVPPHVSIDIFNVIVELLVINPGRRPTIGQIMRRPMVRNSEARSPPTSTQSLPGTPSPSIVKAMTVMGYKSEEIIESLRDQKYNQVMATYLILQHQLPGGDCYHHQEKPVRTMQPGLVLNLADLHTFPVSLGRATEPAPPTFTLPSKTKEKDEKKARQGGTSHSMPAALFCQPERMYPPYLSQLFCPETDSFTSSNLESIEYFTQSEIRSFSDHMTSVQPPLFLYTSSPTPHQRQTRGDTDNMSSCSPQEELWSSQEASHYLTLTGSSSQDTLQEETITQYEAITHDATLTQDEAITQETTLTQQGTMNQEGTMTQNEAITHDATLTQEMTMNHEGTMIQDEAISQKAIMTEEANIMIVEAIIREANIILEATMTQVETITQEEAMTQAMTQEVIITHGQPQDAGPASSRTRRRYSWKRVKKTIVNCFRNLCCCCLPPAERGHASRNNLAPQGRDHGVTPRTSPQEVKPQLHGL
ncbi:sperm motility kinase X-like [Peromyscus eremicus]|uniref:sperm motility kinase X-like n=1 Tax=Peromyscus eremicus TaxID=42410 RepID=UPI0027DCD769|nr:sperm motility kinase X-like [Peromyscus eremicus]XP_059113998.1 sperm motility kinase X-like [Peromyscus eremicus]XP_059113999.1 sperm motility kinase X-like [Peromyscus eremicus]XP_059114000.1 sperm motility kinase X-like [Peromyscus eremicus]XP_059114001.1 sperm motility kinase X-like [Peromyscus eremicus]XP_059114002.1 sperm motility kinase X-like [Peromyscus eremicus]XP_059114003.1 sperm motility kinase X-like [Peromyscus eremicus]